MKPEELTIIEARRLKDKLEADINTLVIEFREQTNLKVTSIYLAEVDTLFHITVNNPL